jgi:replicative DNA helicase
MEIQSRHELPCDIEAEKAVLSCILLDPELINHVSLCEQDFYHPANRQVYALMQDMVSKGKPIDTVTLTGAGMEPQYISDIFEVQAVVANLPTYEGVIKEKTVLRKLHKALSESVDGIIKGQSPYEVIGRVTSAMDVVASRKTTRVGDSIGGYVQEVKDRAAGIITTPITLPTGVKVLDDFLTGGGLTLGQPTILGADTRQGKSSFGIVAALEAVKRGNVLYVTLEDTVRGIGVRCVSQVTGMCNQALQGMSLQSINIRLLEKHLKELGSLNMDVIDKQYDGVDELVGDVIQHVNRYKSVLVIIDYVQKIPAGIPAAREDIEIRYTVGKLVKMAMRMRDTATLILSQFRSRDEDFPPKISDFYGSSIYKQYAYTILLIDEPMSESRMKTIIVGKQKNGRVGWVPVGWDTNTTRFHDVHRERHKWYANEMKIRKRYHI